jgi:N-methylhydantoinase B/oxoprolinase/acetone carboxylase alpha subunit
MKVFLFPEVMILTFLVQKAAEMAVRDKLKKIAHERLKPGESLHAIDYMDDGLKIQLKIDIDHKTGFN